jgi:glycosyltransferase involved in cell wall biosynthesis
MAQRLKVLISAYACEPGKGSEPGTSWEWCVHLARHHDLTVVTRANQRAAIEKEIATLAGRQPVPRFVYHDEPGWVLWLKRHAPASQIWHYALWQRGAEKIIARLVQNEPFDLVQHLSWATFRFHAAIWGHGLPTIWGPIAGAELCPWALLPWRYPGALATEIIRNLATLFHTSRLAPLRARARRSTITMVVSPEMRSACERLGIPAKMLPTLAVHPPSPYERPSSIGRPLRLLFVGRLMYWKGVELALHALHRSETDARYDFIGEGPFTPQAQRLTRKLGLESRVSFRGRVAYDAMVQAYRDYDALLFPSLHDSGGNVVVEAMSHGMPVICLDRGGPGLFVLHGRTGMKIGSGSREEVIRGLAEAIRTYDAQRELLAAHGVAARAHVTAEFTWPHRAAQMDAIYREAVATFAGNK